MAAPPTKPTTAPGTGFSTDPFKDPAADYDSPWKEALEQYFPAFIQLLAPWLDELIDWSQPLVFLNKELQTISYDSVNGRRYTDKLVRVHTKSHELMWLLIHVEVQGGRVTKISLNEFGARTHQYNHRIHDHFIAAPNTAGHHNIGLVSLGVLTKGHSTDTELVYTRNCLGRCGTRFHFPVVYLANWLNRWEELEALAATNPFAVIVMAQLQAEKTGKNDGQRLVSKTNIIRLLYHYKYSTIEAHKIIRLVDWILITPEALMPEFKQAMIALEKEYKMSYVSSLERLSQQRGIEIGEHKGLRKGEASLLQRQLTRKFGALPAEIQQRLQTATLAQLETWSLNILDATDLDSVFTD